MQVFRNGRVIQAADAPAGTECGNGAMGAAAAELQVVGKVGGAIGLNVDDPRIPEAIRIA